MSYAQAASVTEQNVQEQTKVAGEVAGKRIETKSKVQDVIKEFNQRRTEGASTIDKWKSGLGLVAMGVGMATGMGPLALAAFSAGGTGLGGLIGKNQARQDFKGFDYFDQSSDDFLKKTDMDLYKDMASSAYTGYLGGTGIDKYGVGDWKHNIKAGMSGITGRDWTNQAGDLTRHTGVASKTLTEGSGDIVTTATNPIKKGANTLYNAVKTYDTLIGTYTQTGDYEEGKEDYDNSWFNWAPGQEPEDGE